MKNICLVSLAVLLFSIPCIAANVNVLLDSSDGSSALIVNDNIGNRVASFDSTGGLTANSRAQIGPNASATGSYALAMGPSSVASKNTSVAIGFQCTSSGNQAVAIGKSCSASGSNSLALLGGRADAGSAIAIGSGVLAEGTFSMALGTNVSAAADRSFVIGRVQSGLLVNNLPDSLAVGFGGTSPIFMVSGEGVSGAVGIGTTNLANRFQVATKEGASNFIVKNSGSVGIGTSNPSGAFEVMTKEGVSDLKIDNSGNLLAAGNVGLGAANPVNRLDVSGGIVIGAPYAGASTAPSDGALIKGKLGIGTTNPQGKLHVAVTEARADLVVDDATGRVSLGILNPQNTLDVGGPANLGNAVFGRSYSGSVAAPSDSVLVENKLGIGTTAPRYAFDAYRDNPTAGFGLDYPVCLGSNYIGFNNYYNSSWSYAQTTGYVANIYHFQSDGRIGFRTTPAVITGGGSTSWTEAMTIARNANVGIANSGPAVTFEVGSGHALAVNAATGKVGIGTTSPATALDVGANHTLAANTTTGRVGIGTSNPQSSLEVNGAIATKVTTASGSYAMTDSDSIVLVSSGTGCTITLPAVKTGKIVYIKFYNPGAFTYNVTTSGGALIDNLSPTYNFTGSYRRGVILASNGTGWFVMAETQQ
ncbi:MAG TPA: hypothetical protein VMD02_00280 [Candidatus Omnitrophota bacterium]|nr:hypothetical protein [Candidatus Omnitrophota bacterium]